MEQSEIDAAAAARHDALEAMSDEEAHHFLMDENERRVAALFKTSAGAVDLDNAFDFTKIAIYVSHIALDLGILDRADLDFQGKKAAMLDEIEREYDEAMREREAQVARRKLKEAGFRVGGPSPAHPTMRVLGPDRDAPS